VHDYFEILGVPRDARAPEIRRACRGHVRLTHPDIASADSARSLFTRDLEATDVSFPNMAAVVRRMRDAFFA
jgi:curved DNA-binding protein CbpA